MLVSANQASSSSAQVRHCAFFYEVSLNFFSAKSTPGDVIIGILNDAMIDVDKMEEEELLPEDGQKLPMIKH